MEFYGASDPENAAMPASKFTPVPARQDHSRLGQPNRPFTRPPHRAGRSAL